MRFGSLDLIAFGHFGGESLRFTDAPGALDIVYGDNEAGKSTSLRAVSSFLHGIPVRTSDDFVHPKPTLRIGATVIDAAGQSLRLVRRKGAKDTLRNGDDVPVEDDLIDRLLGGLDRELFEQMYALSPDTLERGAADLLSGGGSLGQALFGASLGLAGINNVLKGLESDAAAIFRPGGSNPQLNAALGNLEQLRREARELELRPAEYLGHEQALEETLRERERLDVELQGLRTRLQRGERNRNLLPLVAARGQLLEKIAELGDVVILAPTARERRISAERDLHGAIADVERGQKRLGLLRDALGALSPSDRLLARGLEIRALTKEISAHQKAARDLPGIRTAHRLATGAASALLAQTHPERSLDQVGDLRPTVAARVTMTSLGDDHVRLTEAKRVVDDRLVGMRPALARARDDVAALPPLDDVGPLRSVLAAALKLGDLEGELGDEESRYRSSGEQLLAEFACLPGYAGTLGELETLPVPGEATVARFVERFDELDNSLRLVAGERARVERELTSSRQQLDALDLAGAVPSEGDLEASRALRDSGWQRLRRVLETGEPADGTDLDPGRSLADTYEASVRDADLLADRLRREADRVAQRATLETALAWHSEELTELGRRAEQADVERGRVEDEWHGVWLPTGLHPLTPPEMREWLADRARLVAQSASRRSEAGRLEGRRESLAKSRAAIAGELAALGHIVSESLSLAAVLALGQEVVEDRISRALAAKTARERLAELEHQEREALANIAQSTLALAAWQTAWTDAMDALGLAPELSPEQARTVVETLNELFVKLEAADKETQRIDGIERDARAFEVAVTDVIQDVAPGLAGLAADQAVLQLDQMLVQAQTESTKAEGIAEQIEELGATIAEAKELSEKAREALDRLLEDAHCGTLDELAPAEDRSALALELKARLEETEEQMTRIGAAAPAELARQTESLELEQVELEIEQVEQLVEDLADARREVDEAVGRERAHLSSVRGGDDAAEAFAAIESAKAEVREHAEQYARLRIAASILRGQIEEFRERSHGPLLARAGYFFAKLTCGKFVGLVTGFDERENVVLLGRRRSGREITVEQMSEGTRDQLYLALRLATIEQKLERGEPMPLLVDDLFVNFDNKRAAAGFEALAEIAEGTQVVFFTHHEHLIEIARNALPPERYAVQELGRTPVVSAEAA